MTEKTFLNLHAHSNQGSVYDALGTPTEIIKESLERGLSAVSLTDHGNMNGIAELIQVAKKKNIKAIYGCECYFVPSFKDWKENYDLYAQLKKDKKIVKAEISAEKEFVKEDDATTDKEITNAGYTCTDPSIDLPKIIEKLKDKRHLILIAMNEIGLKNLYKLVSAAHSEEFFYSYPRIDFELLKQNCEGLICSSACIAGLLGKIYFQNVKSPELILPKMIECNLKFKELFGDNFYNEIQFNAIPEQHKINEFVLQAAQESKTKVWVSVDSHYLKADQWKIRKMYNSMRWARAGQDVKTDFMLAEEPDCELHIKNAEDVKESFKKYCLGFDFYAKYDIESMIYESGQMGEKIKHFYPDAMIKMPKFIVSNQYMDAEHELSEMLKTAMKKNPKLMTKKYFERAKMEFDVVKEKGFLPYFLTMKRIVDLSQKHGLCGFGRGSAGGSLMGYLLGIHQIDPLRFGTQFSRFMRKDDTGYPDIDFDTSEPAFIKEKFKEEYGEKSLVYVSNFTRLKIKNLMKDLSKFFKIDFQEVNAVSTKIYEETLNWKRENADEDELISSSTEPSIEEVTEHSKTYREFVEKYPQVREPLEVLAGQLRDLSTHAGGVIIGEDLNERMPLICKKDKMQTPFPEGQAQRLLEPMGFIKFDILGLATLKMVENCIFWILKRKNGVDPTFEEIKTFFNNNLHADTIDFCDADVFKNTFCAGKWLGIFQNTSRGIQEFAQKFQPVSLDDLSTISAIYRPGPLAAKVDERYLEARQKTRDDVSYIHPLHKEVTYKTYGFLIYQEQISELVSKLGKNISEEGGHELRKILTKKGTGKEDKIKLYKELFFEGCKEKGIHITYVEKLWKEIEQMSGYAFNFSHSLAYAMLTYVCAYLFHHHPVEWATAFLQKETESPTKKELAIFAVQKNGFVVRPIDINMSFNLWTPIDEKTISQPFTAIKGLSENAMNAIESNKPFNSLKDLIFNPKIKRKDFGKTAFRALLFSDALDSVLSKDEITNKKALFQVYDEGKAKSVEEIKNKIEELAIPDFTLAERVENSIMFTGMIPYHLIVPTEVAVFLAENGRMSLTELDEQVEWLQENSFYGDGVMEKVKLWAILKNYEIKMSKNKKKYLRMDFVDQSGNQKAVWHWSIKDESFAHSLQRYQVYFIDAKSDPQWGLTVKVPAQIKLFDLEGE